MIKDSSRKNFDVVIVWKLDRFARNRFDSAHYKAALKKNGVTVISATEAISKGSEGVLLETMLEGMAEYYSVEIAEKVNRGMKENALKCKYNGGTLPIGYVIDSDKHYQLDPITSPAVADAFEMYANGMGMQQIADELNIRGVRTQRHNGKLDTDNVTSMLHNRKYIGEYKYKDVVIPGGIPAIVTQEMFDRVQERMALNKKAPAKHKAEDEYLSTKQRLEELEQQKGELSVQIMKEEMSKPVLTREQILFWFRRLRKLNIEKLEHRRKLIDTFINAIYLDDDKMVITFNFKDGSKTITFAEIEAAEKGSDFTEFGAPLKPLIFKGFSHF